jgi:hypothetical protein
MKKLTCPAVPTGAKLDATGLQHYGMAVKSQNSWKKVDSDNDLMASGSSPEIFIVSHYSRDAFLSGARCPIFLPVSGIREVHKSVILFQPSD